MDNDSLEFDNLDRHANAYVFTQVGKLMFES